MNASAAVAISALSVNIKFCHDGANFSLFFSGKIYLLWLFIVTLAFLYNAYSIPLRAVFPYQTDENLKYWLLCDYICDFIYIIDILVFKVRISFLNSGLKEVGTVQSALDI